jgi:hypothetical protein
VLKARRKEGGEGKKKGRKEARNERRKDGRKKGRKDVYVYVHLRI